MATNISTEAIGTSFGQLLHIDGGPEAAEKIVYSALGVATALKLGTVSAIVGNVKINGNTISTENTNGTLILAPNGTGSVAIGAALITGGSITGITDIAIADGGTGASTAVDARTNLGLGTMATQAASAVAITGGTISGVTFSGTISGMTLVSATTVTAVTTLNGGNLRVTANTLSSTDTNGDIVFAPDGSGVTRTDNIQFDGNTIASRNTDGDLNLTPNGTGFVVVPKLKATGSLGYATGAGGAVAQLTSKATGVTLNKLSGQITTFNDSLAATTSVNFVVTNSLIEVGDVVMLNLKSGGTVGAYQISVDAVTAGTFTVNLYNRTAGSLGEALVLNFVVIKGVAA